ncbi:hypothetical protein [Pseudoxanthomonas suwonensis]|uniref:hypothetical protein n=1 Tax=Pseudoxanthomonas suwonensis TaxID=314722 RepID=UPI0018CC3770|nr:hypothetical protein [Pseudoxanthomonas suwonensis]
MMPPSPPSDGALRERLLAALAAGDVDAALQAGLMDYAASDVEDAPIHAAQQRLRTAWAARERYRARAGRLERRALERAARRAQAAAPALPEAPVAEAPVAARPVPSLPPAAAAALARAKARAAGRTS